MVIQAPLVHRLTFPGSLILCSRLRVYLLDFSLPDVFNFNDSIIINDCTKTIRDGWCTSTEYFCLCAGLGHREWGICVVNRTPASGFQTWPPFSFALSGCSSPRAGVRRACSQESLHLDIIKAFAFLSRWCHCSHLLASDKVTNWLLRQAIWLKPRAVEISGGNLEIAGFCKSSEIYVRYEDGIVLQQSSQSSL